MNEDTTIDRVVEDLDQLLRVDLHAELTQPGEDFLVGKSLVCFPAKSLLTFSMAGTLYADGKQSV